MAGKELILPTSNGSYNWSIQPENMSGVLTAVKINPQWVPNLVELLPPGVIGSVQSEEELLWSSVNKPESQREKASEIPFIQGTSGPAPVPPPQVGKTPDSGLSPIVNSTSEKKLGVENQPLPAGTQRGMRSLNLILTGVALAFLGIIIYVLHMAMIVYPDISFRTAFLMMAGNAFDNGYFFIFFLITAMIIIGILVYPFTMRDIEEAKKQAMEIVTLAERGAQEAKEIAEKEAYQITAQAKQEAQEIRNLAEKDTEEIRSFAEEEAQEVKVQVQQVKAEAEQNEQKVKELQQEAEVVLLKAEAEAAEILESAKHDAKGIISQARAQSRELWSWCEAKAKDAGVTPEGWKEVQKIRDEARQVLESARKEATGNLSHARAQAANSEQAPRQQALEEAQGVLNGTGPEALEIVGQAQEGTEKSSSASIGGIQDHLPDDETSHSDQDQVAALEERILGLILGQREMKKRDLERKAAKSYYGQLWELAIANLMKAGRIIYDTEIKIYRCQSE